MAIQKQQCIQSDTMQKYLQEKLNDADEADVLDHIEGCDSCRQLMENLAGQNDGWHEMRDHLQDHQGDLFDQETIGFEGSESDRDLEMERLKGYLGPTDDPNMLGRLGPYEVCGLVGRGSTGVVVKAYDSRLGRYVAIKVLSPSFSSNGAARRRFQREAKSVAAVTSDHVVPIHDVAEYRGLPYIVMHYIPGGSMAQRIEKNGPLDTTEIVRIGMQIAGGLAAAHKQGIVHRDVKPANVMLESSVERAMVTDFGLARVADEAAMTRSGVIAGTPQYMSPEQAMGDPIDARSDLFSLGSVLYTACTGRAPFRSESVFGVIKKVCEVEPRPIREINTSIEPWLVEFIQKLQEKDRDDRFDSAEQVASLLSDELGHLQNPTMIPAPQRPWLVQKPVAPTKPVKVEPRKSFPWTMAASFMALAISILAIASGLGGNGLKDNANNQSNDDGKRPGAFVLAQTNNQHAYPKHVSMPNEVLYELFEFERQLSFDIDAGCDVSFEGSNENLIVNVSEDDELKVVVVQKIDAETKKAARKMSKLFNVDVNNEDGNVVLKSSNEYEGEEYPWRGIDVKVWIPSTCNLDCKVANGNLEIGGFEGEVVARTTNGNISVGKCSGKVELTSENGNVRSMIGGGATVTGTIQNGSIAGTVWDSDFGDSQFRSQNGNIEIGIIRGTNARVRSESGRNGDDVYEKTFGDGGSVISTTTMNGSVNFKAIDEVPDQDCDTGCDSDCESSSCESESTTIGLAEHGVAGRTVAIEREFSGGILDGYTLYLPVEYNDSNNEYPVIISLCGGCGVGGEIADACNYSAIGKMLVGHQKMPESIKSTLTNQFIVVCPHMIGGGTFEERQFYNQEKAFEELFADLGDQYRVDATRVYLTGTGRGGHGAWGLASRMPEKFAAIVPVRGESHGIDSHENLASLPIWTGHNKQDTECDFEDTLNVTNEVTEIDGKSFCRLAEEDPAEADDLMSQTRIFTAERSGGYPNLFRHAELYDWLLQFDNRR